MADYIKREDVMELLDMLLEHYHDTVVEVIKHTAAIAPKEFHISEEDDIADFNFEIYAWKKDFLSIPSADVAPVRHGRWIEATRDDPCYYVCSICGKMVDIEENYCPNCGAKMDE